MSWSRRFFFLFLMTALWMAGLQATFAQEAPVKVGVLLPLSGEMASFGEPLRRVAELATNHVNEQGGVLGGRRLELLFADDGTDPERAVAEARRLVADERVAALITVPSAATMRVATEVTIPRRLVHLTLSTSPRLSQLADNGYVFRVVPSDVHQARTLAELATRLGYAHVAVLYVDNEYGIDLAHHFAEHFTEIGGRVAARVPFVRGRRPFRKSHRRMDGNRRPHSRAGRLQLTEHLASPKEGEQANAKLTGTKAAGPLQRSAAAALPLPADGPPDEAAVNFHDGTIRIRRSRPRLRVAQGGAPASPAR